MLPELTQESKKGVPELAQEGLNRSEKEKLGQDSSGDFLCL